MSWPASSRSTASPQEPGDLDPKKLDWVNAEYINGMSDAQFADEIMVPELHEAGLIEGNVEYGED